MQQIYMQSSEQFEVFTTVLAPQGRYRYRSDSEKMVVVHRYRPHWPDELELCPGDVILVLSKHEEGRWFGRIQSGQQGFFPASCVMELDQANLPIKTLQRRLSLRTPGGDGQCGRYGNGHILQGLKRGSRGGGGGGGGRGGKGGGGGVDLDGSRGNQHGPFLGPRLQIPQPLASQSQTHRSPNLLHRILYRYRKKGVCQGATNEAFEID